MTTVQNIYDNSDFYAGYSALRQNEQGFNSTIEQPALRSLVSEIKNKIILDIGCGFGDFCRYAAQEGAQKIIGIDASRNMIEEAKNRSKVNAINYQQCAIEDYSVDRITFDLIISSLTFHYVADYSALIKNIKNWLKPGGSLVFSVEHPICTAYPEALLKTDENSKEFHPLYNYRDEKSFTQTWFVEGVIKYHRTLATYLNTLIENGFIIDKMLEPMPNDKLLEERPDFEKHKIRPPLLMIKSHLTIDNDALKA